MGLILGIVCYGLLGTGIILYQARILNQKHENEMRVVYTGHRFEKEILLEIERQEKVKNS